MTHLWEEIASQKLFLNQHSALGGGDGWAIALKSANIRILLIE